MNKLRSACALALCFVALNTNAQTDAKAKGILDAATKKVNSLKSLKANFTLKLTGGKVKDSKKGTIALKGPKYHILLAGQEIICDNKTIWTYNVENKEVSISNFNPKEQSISPAKLLTNFYDKEYTYKYVGERKEAGKAVDVVELTPVDKSKKVSKIELLVDKSSSMITGGNIWEKNGNKMEYIVSNMTPNAAIPDSYFTWDAKAHAGVEVNDLR